MGASRCKQFSVADGILERAHQEAHHPRARRDRQCRQILIEGSFAEAANNHGFERARWRRSERQQIQDWLIAGIQNIRTLLKVTTKRAGGAAQSWRWTSLRGPACF